MRRKLLIGGLVLALCVALVGPAAAKGKKKKGPKPYKSPEVTIQVGHPAFYGTSGTLVSVTAQEFIARCALPASNGVDAYVFEVPADYQKIQSAIKVFGSGAAIGHDLDIYPYDSDCVNTIAYNSTTPDETGVLPSGIAYIVIHNYGTATPQGGGSPVQTYFELKPA